MAEAESVSGDEPAETNAHADKYNDPRAVITPRGIAIAIAVLLLGSVGAALSIYARKTKLGETTRFWGQETITALQLAERIELRSRGTLGFKPVDLSGTPGLGHLRRLLLDERNYDWASEQAGSALADCGKPQGDRPRCVQLRLTDPTAQRVGPIEIDLDLETGWIGPGDGSRRVRATERVQPKLANYIGIIVSVEQKRLDFRDEDRPEG